MPLNSRFPSILSVFFLSLFLVACLHKSKSEGDEPASLQSPQEEPETQEPQLVPAYQINEGSGGVVKHATGGGDNGILLVSEVVTPLSYEVNPNTSVIASYTVRFEAHSSLEVGDAQTPGFNNILNNLAMSEFSKQASSSTGDNFVITPPSTLNVATLISTAASAESATKINTALNWSESDAIDLNNWQRGLTPYADILTTIWGQIEYPFSDGYVDSLLLQNNTEFLPVDFQTQLDGVIENIETSMPEVFSPTNPKILSLMENNSARTKTAFANKFSLSADFVELELTDGLWRDNSPHQEIVPMVKLSGFFSTYESIQYKAIKIPFVDSSISLSIVMPSKNHFTEVETRIGEVVAELRDYAISQEVDFMLPLFDIKSENDLSKIIPNGKVNMPTGISALFESADSDYTNVTLADELERGGLFGESAISLSQSGLVSDSIAATKLISTIPPSWTAVPGSVTGSNCDDVNYTCSPVSSGSGFSQVGVNNPPQLPAEVVSINTLEDCETVYEPLGATQARPFIFVVSDEFTGNILQMGRVVKLDGEIAQRLVCEGERSILTDNIMPLRTGEADDHVEVSKFIETASQNQQPLAQSPDELNKLLLTYLSNEANDGNYLAPSMNQLMLSVLTESAGNENLFRDWLGSIGSGALPSTLLESIGASSKMFSQSDSVLWVQPGYKYKSELFEMISGGLDAELRSSDFLNNASEQKLDIENWLSGVAPENFAYESMIGNRTRLFLASKSNSRLPMSGESIMGKFKTIDDAIVTTPMSKFSGRYPFYENTLLEAIEIPSEEGSLLVVIPKKSAFDRVQSELDEQVKNIVDNLSVHDIQFSIPLFSIENEASKKNAYPARFFENITSLRPILALPQYSKNSINFDKQGVQNDAYSFTAFAAPAENTPYILTIISGTSAGFSEQFSMNPIFYGLINRDDENVDNRPFFFFVRDEKSGLLQQVGKFVSVSGN